MVPFCRIRLAWVLIAALSLAGLRNVHAGESRFETITLTNGDPVITVQLAHTPGVVGKQSVILMPGSLNPRQLPAWSTNLVREGFMLAAFSAAYPSDPDPARRPQWLFFDQRFAHSYVLGGERAPRDAGRVMDYLQSRPDVNAAKIGWLGSSSTGIPGLSVAVREKRLAALVAFVSTGAYRHWLATWHTNKLWQGKTTALWPATESLLLRVDPVLFATNLFPCAVLMVNGGRDKVVDPDSARAFVDAARPAYQADPGRLRLVMYEGFSHNLPLDVVQLHAEHWFRLYLHPVNAAPAAEGAPATLNESARRTQINATDHRDIIKAKE